MSEYFDDIKAEKPYGLEAAVDKILKRRVGIDNAIKKKELLELLGYVGFSNVDERQVRLAISVLRKSGALIGSTNTDGYFYISSLNEWQRVRSQEFMSRVKDILETVRILDRAAKEAFGNAYSPTLFDLSELEGEFPELRQNGRPEQE